ncbi:MAG: signal peptide peptidase SppA [Porphyromonas sp.]|nr:signal peptide peptidase SppA [Porphyromonas sp.]
MKQFFKMVFASCLGVILASIVAMILFFFVVVSAITASISAFTSSEDSSVFQVKHNSILEIVPSGQVSDTKEDNPFAAFIPASKGSDAQLTLSEIKRAIRTAAEDNNIKAIYIDFSLTGMGYATAQEIRQELEDFKKSGKMIYTYADILSDKAYYLASVADKLYMNPEGMLPIMGLSRQVMFYTGPLQKLGVEMQIFKVGTFKGAVEPFMLKKLSEPNRLQLQEYIDGLWENMATAIVDSRSISRDSLEAFVNRGYGMGGMAKAVEFGLVDSLMYSLDLKPMLAERYTGERDKESYNGVTVSQYLRSKGARISSKGDAIGVIVAEGEIREAMGDFESASIIDMGVASKLRELAEDDDIKAVVMRVNSPGGSAFISEQVWKEVNDLKAKKPIVVSMGDYAASGGYYISCAANKIFADPTTLTGSIGIFGRFPNFAGVASKIDLTVDVVKTHELSDLGNTFRPMTDKEKAVIQNLVERGYELFKKRVADGRGMTVAQVDSVGQGRVWLGGKALELGLVDKLGTFEDAVEEAARLAEVDKYYLYYPKGEKKEWWMKLLGGTADVKAGLYNSLLSPEEQKVLNAIRKAKNTTGILAMPEIDITE